MDENLQQRVLKAVEEFEQDKYCECGKKSNMCYLTEEEMLWTCLECYDEIHTPEDLYVME